MKHDVFKLLVMQLNKISDYYKEEITYTEDIVCLLSRGNALSEY